MLLYQFVTLFLYDLKLEFSSQFSVTSRKLKTLGREILSHFVFWSKVIRGNVDFSPSAKSLKSCLILCGPWTIAPQAPLSTEFSRQEY